MSSPAAIRKADFIAAHAAYGYDGRLDELRTDDFPQQRRPLPSASAASASQHSSNGVVYLDHAGATLYGASQLRSAMECLLSAVHGNPHSQGPVSSVTADRIEAARLEVLAHFNAHPREYSVIFTSGATAALKLVGEAFPWSTGSEFAHAVNSHTSVLGIRELAAHGGATSRSVDLRELEQQQQRCYCSAIIDEVLSFVPAVASLHSF